MFQRPSGPYFLFGLPLPKSPPPPWCVFQRPKDSWFSFATTRAPGLTLPKSEVLNVSGLGAFGSGERRCLPLVDSGRGFGRLRCGTRSLGVVGDSEWNDEVPSPLQHFIFWPWPWSFISYWFSSWWLPTNPHFHMTRSRGTPWPPLGTHLLPQGCAAPGCFSWENRHTQPSWLKLLRADKGAGFLFGKAPTSSSPRRFYGPLCRLLSS